MTSALDDTRWVTSAMLAALAARSKAKGDTFTSVNMREWVPALQTGTKCRNAAEKLLKLRWVTLKAIADKAAGSTYSQYTITAAGAAAIAAVASGKPHKSGPKGPHKVSRTPGNTTFIARLWALMRARGMLNSQDAASTLVDAGGDVKKAADYAQRCMAHWVAVGAVAESRVRETNGCKRYVLVKNTPTPPEWTATAQARKAAITSA